MVPRNLINTIINERLYLGRKEQLFVVEKQ